MKNISRLVLITLCLMLIFKAAEAEKFHSTTTKSTDEIKQIAAGCEPGSSYKYLDINNVRTLIYSYGNGWFLEIGEYEIPKGSKKTSMYSYSLWIGGIDVNNNLKMAGYRYGQGPSNGTPHTHNDYWPGPLTIDGTAAVSEQTCAQYDRLFPITRQEVQEFIAWFDNKAAYPDYSIPKSITDWPAHGDISKGQAYYLAPFFDRNDNGKYDPKNDGDYPYYDLANKLCPRFLKPGEKVARAKLRNGEPDDTLGILVDQVLKGDQTLWSVFNDKGNFHSESQGDPIGMEIREQAFAFSTNDEINNMTFYSYEIINRSTYTLTGTYFSQWVDPDLGFAEDDYVGCDVTRGLGYCYNGKPIDGTGQIQAYGAHPPAVGVDFFQGPYMDPDGRDNPRFTGDCSIINSAYPEDQMAINGVNFGDGIVDNERFGMRRFVYHNNNLSGVPLYMQDPNYAPEYYNFLRGIWRDNTKMKYGGNAHIGTGAIDLDCDFMFPGVSDICDWGTKGVTPVPKNWTEETANNNPSDRRFMQSAGPFTLQPGACNYITVGIPWARSISGTPFDAVTLLQQVDDKCQALFDNCFAVLNGPDAPDLTIQEMDKKLIIYITNRQNNDAGNNYQEKYFEIDPTIPEPDSLPHNARNDSVYHFEGYQLFQLLDATVSSADLDDPNKARLVGQFDIQNGVTKLVNWNFSQDIGGNVGTVMVTGTDKGIQHSFVVTQDQFATGDLRLINHKQYYYMAIAYAYNNWKTYNQSDPNALNGQKKPYLRGRNNLKQYTGIPHIPLTDVANSTYGEGPVITRIQGHGNGGMVLELSDSTLQEILSKPPADTLNNKYGSADYPISYHPVYKVSHGPLQVKVIDPLNVVNGQFEVRFDSMSPGPAGSRILNPLIKFGHWKLIEKSSGKVFYSDTTTVYPYESLFIDQGLALTINQVPYPGDTLADGSIAPNDNGLLSAPAAIYADSTKKWLSGVQDNDVPGDPANWIRSGTYVNAGNPANNDYALENKRAWDPLKNYAKIQGGTWAPYALASSNDQFPPFNINNVGTGTRLGSRALDPISNCASVDIVLTPDYTKWTRCPVIETCPITSISEGHAIKFHPREHRSVNVDGDTAVKSSDPFKNSDYIDPYGMGWFPGYAINLETGTRLNIIFGENSWLVADNGRDMIFNPSPRQYDLAFNPVFGGQHFIYIMNQVSFIDKDWNNKLFDFPAYDCGAYMLPFLRENSFALEARAHDNVFASTMYVGIPLSVYGQKWLSNEVTIKIRIGKPYERYYAATYRAGDKDTVNKGWPVYTFSTQTISTSKNNQDKSTSMLDLINVVPNPYYAYDDYERNQLDNRIKIVNLPNKCTVTIFDMSGTMIRQFVLDKSGITLPRSSISGLNTDSKTSIDWDLKNFAGIPIAGGVYLIHVKAEGLGERTLKWFGILRPIDLNSF